MEGYVVYELTGVLNKVGAENEKAYINIEGEEGQRLKWQELKYNIYIKEDINDLSDNSLKSHNDVDSNQVKHEDSDNSQIKSKGSDENNVINNNTVINKKYIILKLDEKLILQNEGDKELLYKAFLKGKKVCIGIEKDDTEYVVKKVEILK